MEDLGVARRLDQLLLGDDAAAAEEGLLAYARTLGRLHAPTVGQESAYWRLRDGLGPRQEHDAHFSYAWVVPTLGAAAHALGYAPSPDALDDAVSAVAAMRAPGLFRAYTHGDSCPDNCILLDGAMRLFDLQWSTFGHALLDASTARLYLGTCWCVNSLPPALPGRMEWAYRAEVVVGCPEPADDGLFYAGLVAACAVRVVQFCHDFPLATLLARDRRIAISTARQVMLRRFEILARTTEEYGHLPALGAALGEMATRLRALWPREAGELPLYPAFR
jgi:hypothetical protein